MKRNPVLTITLAVMIMAMVSIAVIPTAYSQEVLPPKVVKFEIDRTAVYAGYQGIEVKAYIYAPSAPRLSLARATLISGLTVVVNLTLTELQDVVPITVKNITYNVKYIALGKIIVPEGVYVGPAILDIEVVGSVGATTFSNSTRFRVTILSSRYVEEDRMNAYRAFERASIITFIASTLGVDTTKAMETLNNLEAMLRDADTKLIVAGEVEEASHLYKAVVSKAEELSSSLFLDLTKISRETSNSLVKLNNDVNSLSNRLSILANYSENLAKTLKDYADSTGKALTTLNNQIIELSTKLTGVVDYVNNLGNALTQYSIETNKAIETLSKDLNALAKQQEDAVKNINNAITTLGQSVNTLINTLSNNIDSLTQSQNRIASTLNNLQLSLLVLSVAVIIAIAITILRAKR